MNKIGVCCLFITISISLADELLELPGSDMGLVSGEFLNFEVIYHCYIIVNVTFIQ